MTADKQPSSVLIGLCLAFTLISSSRGALGHLRPSNGLYLNQVLLTLLTGVELHLFLIHLNIKLDLQVELKTFCISKN